MTGLTQTIDFGLIYMAKSTLWGLPHIPEFLELVPGDGMVGCGCSAYGDYCGLDFICALVGLTTGKGGFGIWCEMVGVEL